MSLWGKIAAGAVAVGGSFIPGVGPALAIPAAASILAGDNAAGASKDAAKTLSAAGDKALAANEAIYRDTRGVQDRVYNASQASFAPYMDIGGRAVGSLGQLLNLPPGATSAAAAGGVPAPQAPGASAAEMAVARGGVGTTPNARAAAQNASTYRGTLGGAAGVVPLVGPDGTTRTVPAAQAPFYISKGARILGNDQTGGGSTEVL
jgi:hypothetical protein